MKPNHSQHRVEQVADGVRCEISRLLLFEVRDPQLKHVTITQVRMTADLKEAWVYYDWAGPEANRDAIDQALQRASGFIRHELAQVLSFKFVPQLFFHFDETRAIYDRASALIDKTHK